MTGQMNKKNTDELIISHLEYIRKRVDDINGRVRKNESAISRIKGIGGTLATLFIALLGWFKLEDFK